MRSDLIRRRFLDYFVQRAHREVASSSLVPADDPTLLFTNAGMVQFKRTFLGVEHRDYRRATTSQKCVRAGGKHNDLEQVGHTDRHHTFFEMLGNFSFGDYFKRDAIAFAWEFVTSQEWLGIDPARLRISVHHKDDEARRLWREIAGLPDAKIYGLGDKDNFWQMADTGPCGPCSEIYVDMAGTWNTAGERGVPGRTPGAVRPQGAVRPGEEPAPLASPPPAHASDHVHSLDQFVEAAEAGRFLEIWNLVFMQFDRQTDGTMVPLPAPSVDTGAGLERIAAVLQGETSNFHTDLFLPLIRRAERVVGRSYDRGDAGAPFRVLADHARAVAFLLADGVYPSNEGRGYVLRRILRRGVRHAYLLGRREPTLALLVDEVVKVMGGVYPDLPRQAQHLADVTRAEEERFLETIVGGLERMEQLTSVSAEEAFKLYDTYGFPIDLTQIVAAERGMAVDTAGFEALLDQQRARSRKAAGKSAAGAPRSEGAPGSPVGRLPAVARRPVSPEAPSSLAPSATDGAPSSLASSQAGGAPAVHGAPGSRVAGWVRVKPRARQKWVGYETTRAATDILAFQRDAGRLGLILHENPFYAESGGQVADTGEVIGQGWRLAVDEVAKVEGRTAVFGAFEGSFEPTPVDAVVAERARQDTERNHTATHLLHAALRKVLGPHVRQAGSVVSPERLRFDFTHHQPVPAEALAAVEAEANAHVWENLDVERKQMAYADALAAGAMALFGEKYGDVVRVITVPGVSRELCGGTHARTTGQIGLIRVVSESGVGAGVRRIEALTGPGAYGWLLDRSRLLEGAAGVVGSAPEHLARRVEALLDERRRLEKRVEELIKGGGASAQGDVTQVAGSAVTVAASQSGDRNEIGAMIDAFRERTPSGVLVVVAQGERPGIHVGVTDDLVQRGVTASDLANRIAAVSGGKGGGRPHFASAGAGDPAKLPEAERRAAAIVAEALGAKP